MMTKMFSVFDSKAACYGTPFFMPQEAMAIRAFSNLVNDSSSLVSQHPGDFTLYYLGNFDDSVGSIDSVKPAALVTASAMKKLPSFNVPPEILDTLNCKPKEASV